MRPGPRTGPAKPSRDGVFIPRGAGPGGAGEKAAVPPDLKSVEIMRKFSETYANRTETYFCQDKGVTSVVIKGLAEHKDTLGAALCPCRHYEDKELEVKNGFWNCPCVPMRERQECHCMLFLTEDNPFAGGDQRIDLEEIVRNTDPSQKSTS